ncbi:GNAT family N-acetyltransferase [Streptomyces nodosus]|uniref:GNAT family N-acetyltransferase n=1 Tax=Streptomyces nodosus TaxID=40318 RepID=UPI003453BE7E
MPPPDARTDTDTDAGTASAPEPADPRGPGPGAGPRTGPDFRSDCEETLELRLPDPFMTPPGPSGPGGGLPQDDDLLDQVAEWGGTSTSVGTFQLVPVDPGRDLQLIARWMNDPAVAVFWDLAGDTSVTERHLYAQLTGDGRSVPCLGVLDGTPMSYWEIYRADLDPLARHFPARPHDTGVHLLIGGVGDRGRGLGSALLRAVADLVLDRRPSCARVVAEPDLRNTPSVAAFLSAGFRFSAELDLPGKRAALMIRDRSLRALLQDRQPTTPDNGPFTPDDLPRPPSPE